MIFKTTVKKSNPQIIRVFEIDGESTIEDLLKTVYLIHNWEIGKELSLYRNGREMLESEQLKVHFREEKAMDEWEIRGEFAGRMYSSGSSNWVLRLETEDYTDTAENEEIPRLLRFRGLHPDTSFGSVKGWNSCVYRSTHNQSSFGYAANSLTGEQYEPDLAKINGKLNRVVRMRTVDIHIAWEISEPLKKILEGQKVNDLKDIIMTNRLPISYNQRKNDLLFDLLRHYDRDSFWRRVLEEMGMEEYERFQDYATGKELFYKDKYPVLLSYGLIPYSYFSYEAKFPRELLVYYEEMMKSGDSELVFEKKIKEVLSCACRLYGVFPRSAVYGLGEVMYPEVDLHTCLDQYWVTNREHEIYSDSIFYRTSPETSMADLMYDRGKLTAITVKKYWSTISRTEMDYYLPQRQEAFDIVRGNGLRFTRETEVLLQKEIKSLERPYSMYSEYVIVRSLYDLLHMNYPLNEIPGYLRRYYALSGDNTKYQKLLELLKQYSQEVRQILFCGHTGTEARQLYHLEVEE